MFEREAVTMSCVQTTEGWCPGELRRNGRLGNSERNSGELRGTQENSGGTQTTHVGELSEELRGCHPFEQL